MKRIVKALALAGVCGLTGGAALAASPVNQLTEAEARSGWRLLFDGKSAEGWRNFKKDSLGKGWVIEDGAIVRKAGGAGDILTKDQFDSFELQLEYRISKGGNSGLMFHVTEEANTPWMTGPEVQIQDNVDGHDPQKAGWLYQLYKPVKPDWAKRFEQQVGITTPEETDATRPAGQWNHLYLRVTAKDGEVCLNGVSYFTFQKGSKDWNERVAKSKFASMPLFGKPEKGHISLQDHGNEVAFRNIKVRELPNGQPAKEPVDGALPLKTVPAFPNVTWEGWSPETEDGKPAVPMRPLQVTHAGDGSGRVFVLDQSGMIHVLPNDPAARQAKLFLDHREKTHLWRKDDEEGLLGMAFHPESAKNGQFFLCYSPEAEPRMMYVSRFSVSKTDRDKADPASEEVVLKIKQPFANHNGGSIAFGPDGYLYIALGDGGGRNDPLGSGQSRKTLMGSILRIDVNHRDEGKGYAVPKDNPFVGQEGIPGEVYAFGFRNIWRATFDRQTGSLWAADVGQDLWEEINIVRKGGNYGWSTREGTRNFGNQDPVSDVVDPVWEYDHRLGKSITGGHVYRGTQHPELAGHYLYGDYVTGRLWALHYDEQAGKVVRNMSIAWSGLPVLGFGEDESGEVFVTTPSAGGQGVFRIVKE